MKGIALQSGEREGVCNLGGPKNMTWNAWSSYLQGHFKKLPGIKQYYYFKTTKENPGAIYFKVTTTDEWQS